MILRELFYFDKDNLEPIEDLTYSPSDDTSVLKIDDSRKTRLSLRDINKARKAAESHQKDTVQELEKVKQMYGLAAQAAAAV
jgi:predicted RNA-binding protein with RPS1 domain|tara:strand:- start:5300 stop:5545 length:246 start_codon:yes stop_codon:yes gene_type:complete